MKKTTIGILFGIASYVAWGTNGTFFATLLNIGISDMAVVALAPTILWLFFGLKTLITDKSQFKLSWKGFLFVLFAGTIMLNAQNITYVKAVATVPVAVISILMFSNVIILSFLSKICFGYKYTTHKIIAIIASLFGVSLVLNLYSGVGFSSWGSGIWWAIVIPFVMAVNFTLIKYTLNEGVSMDAYLFYINFFGALVIYATSSSPVAMVTNVFNVISTNGISALIIILGFALIPCIISYWAVMKAYDYIEPTYISLCSASDPVTASICGLIFLGQMLTINQVVGIAVVISAIIYINYMEGKEELAASQGEASLGAD
ncbi:putative permease, DMT superfamily [Desulfosporosinus orientis DSM 765]|uniref:Putative permease, DMT superfamily n=1 Tax=Desulfosporosinus orientis (strain ATCC 19365 / DSM 765 / NCIMB 8382 / VKM B-1628 / Singapore I) TaxID=768706 RepID=G7W6W5_DESOD|nr:DMT family transporter [Desulfosporosinus orientis]AET69822.1 putative permease, DMT superfamily [Desulfosporosinus orientis DSM 765]